MCLLPYAGKFELQNDDKFHCLPIRHRLKMFGMNTQKCSYGLINNTVVI